MGGPSGKRQQPPAVSIADLGKRSVRKTNREEKIEQLLDPRLDGCRYLDAVASGQDEEMEVDLGGVPLVASGLLKVHAVCQDLAFTLLDQDPSAYLPPAVGRAQLREHHSGIHQSQRLAGQVGVRRKIIGEISFDMQRMSLDRR